jgi:hypothetical protein
VKKVLANPAPNWGLVVVAFISLTAIVFGADLHQIRATEVDPELGIDELLQSVKKELAKSDQNRQGAGEAALFEVKNFDLEINFTVKKTKSIGGQLEYKVITADSKAEVAQEKVQKIVLHMSTLPPEPVEVLSDDLELRKPAASPKSKRQ